MNVFILENAVFSMQETSFIWVNGEFVPWNEAKTHVLTHGLHYGSGVFEGIRCYSTSEGSAIFRLRDHVDRFFRSAHAMGMTIPYTHETINQAIIDTVKTNRLSEGYIRPLAFFDYGKIGLGIEEANVKVIIAVWPWESYLGNGPVRVKTSTFMRSHPKSFPPYAKISGSYVNSILASSEAKKQGYDEALLLDHLGNVAEGPGENFFIIKGRTIFTPVLGNILPGITRECVIKIARDKGYIVREIPMHPKEVYYADEAFFTGTAAEISPIASLDGVPFKQSPGELTIELKQRYSEIVRGQQPYYNEWLTLIN